MYYIHIFHYTFFSNMLLILPYLLDCLYGMRLGGCADMHVCGYAARRDTVIGHVAL